MIDVGQDSGGDQLHPQGNMKDCQSTSGSNAFSKKIDNLISSLQLSMNKNE